MNIMSSIQMLMQGPQGIINKVLGDNPMANNLISMINNKDQNGIEQMARNLAKEKGVNADELYNKIKSQFGM